MSGTRRSAACSAARMFSSTTGETRRPKALRIHLPDNALPESVVEVRDQPLHRRPVRKFGYNPER